MSEKTGKDSYTSQVNKHGEHVNIISNAIQSKFIVQVKHINVSNHARPASFTSMFIQIMDKMYD